MPEVVFTSAHFGQSRLRHVLDGMAEVAAGRNRLERLYHRWRNDLSDATENLYRGNARSAVARRDWRG